MEVTVVVAGAPLPFPLFVQVVIILFSLGAASNSGFDYFQFLHKVRCVAIVSGGVRTDRQIDRERKNEENKVAAQ